MWRRRRSSSSRFLRAACARAGFSRLQGRRSGDASGARDDRRGGERARPSDSPDRIEGTIRARGARALGSDRRDRENGGRPARRGSRRHRHRHAFRRHRERRGRAVVQNSERDSDAYPRRPRRTARSRCRSPFSRSSWRATCQPSMPSDIVVRLMRQGATSGTTPRAREQRVVRRSTRREGSGVRRHSAPRIDAAAAAGSGNYGRSHREFAGGVGPAQTLKRAGVEPGTRDASGHYFGGCGALGTRSSR